MKRERAVSIAVLVILVLVAGASPVAAGMNWDAAIYLWALGMEGSTRVRGQDAEVDLSFGDIAQNLDMAVAVHLEGATEAPGWGFFFDVFWADLGQDLEQPLGDIDMQMAYVEGAVTYATDENFVVFLGARNISIDMDLTFDFNLPGPGLLPLPSGVGGDQSWTDLMVGGRVQTDLGDKWGFRARFDLAGFGISNSSDFTWNLVMLGQRRWASGWSFVFGYRILDIDYSDADSGFIFDIRQTGPILAAGYSF